jgi:putative ubiquitin-RnfH superfamily antitoxin RatB of RatAB toxin-antitoxin module
MATDKERLKVEVVFATPVEQVRLEMEIEPGTTVGEAIARSGIESRCPGLRTSTAPVGIFGKRARRDTLLKDGDRVEIYRSLVADPKVMRRQRMRKR